MKRADVLTLIVLFAVILTLYYPVLSVEYLYTDDALYIWLANKGIALAWMTQGRFITYKLFTLLFGHISTVHNLIYARLFSLGGWLTCLPIWYFIIKDIVIKNALPAALTFFFLIYMVCIPPFSISVAWASCMELFIANTCGLASGYVLYKGIQNQNNSTHVSTVAIIISLSFGVVSLFTYQNGFGCFFIPLFLQMIAAKKISRHFYIAIGFSIFTWAVYYLLFKTVLKEYGSGPSSRNTLAEDPVKKILFFIAEPMKSAFHFTLITEKNNIAGKIIYVVIAISWLVNYFARAKTKTISKKISYLAGIFLLLLFVYLPSLIVKENYASNRTLFALDLAIFILVAESLLTSFRSSKWQYACATGISLLFVLNAWYNLHTLFLQPVTTEYGLIKNAVYRDYSNKTDTVYFIQPMENTFEKRYGIATSMDEFGVPSTAKKWVPEPFIRQLIFEKTGSHQLAEHIVVQSWPDSVSFLQSGKTISEKTILINAEKMLIQQNK